MRSEKIYCPFRRKWVAATPEEYVRQQFLHYLVEELHYPMGRIGVEVALQKGDYRCDAVIFSSSLQPRMLIEFKAETVPLTQSVLDQAATYNRHLRVPWLILHNGNGTVIMKIFGSNLSQWQFYETFPTYEQICESD